MNKVSEIKYNNYKCRKVEPTDKLISNREL